MKNTLGRPLKYKEPTQIVTLRVPISLIRGIHKLSQANKRSFSEEVVFLIEQRVRKFKRKGVI